MLKRFTTIMAAGLIAATVTVPVNADTESCVHSRIQISSNLASLIAVGGTGTFLDVTDCTESGSYIIEGLVNNSIDYNGCTLPDLSKLYEILCGSGSGNNTEIETETVIEESTEENTEAFPEQTTEEYTMPAETTAPLIQQGTVEQETTTHINVEQTTSASQGTTNNNTSMAKQVVDLVNEQRTNAGLSPLTYDTTLSAAAQKRAQEIVSVFQHTRPDGSSFYSVLKEFGISYSSTGENIAYGQRSAQEVMNGWMNSSGHRANIMNTNFDKIGVGVYVAPNGTIYWTQLFTK